MIKILESLFEIYRTKESLQHKMRSEKNKQQPWGWKLLPPYFWAALHPGRPSSASPFTARSLGLVATLLVVFWVL